MYIIGEIKPNKKRIIVAFKDKFLKGGTDKENETKDAGNKVVDKLCPRCKAAVIEKYQGDIKTEEKCSNGCYVIHIKI